MEFVNTVRRASNVSGEKKRHKTYKVFKVFLGCAYAETSSGVKLLTDRDGNLLVPTAPCFTDETGTEFLFELPVNTVFLMFQPSVLEVEPGIEGAELEVRVVKFRLGSKKIENLGEIFNRPVSDLPYQLRDAGSRALMECYHCLVQADIP